MSMAINFDMVTPEAFNKLKNGEMDFSEIEENNSEAYENGDSSKSGGVGEFSMDLIEYLDKGNKPLFALLNESDEIPELEETVMFARVYNDEAIANVVKAFQNTDLRQMASEMGQPEEGSETTYGTLYKRLAHLQTVFENAQKNNSLIVSSAN